VSKHAEGLIGARLRPGPPFFSDCSGHLTHRGGYGNSIRREALASATFGHSPPPGKRPKSVCKISPDPDARASGSSGRFRQEAAATPAPPACCCHAVALQAGHASRSAPGSAGAPAQSHPPTCLARREALSKQGKPGRHQQGRTRSDKLRRASPLLAAVPWLQFNAKPGDSPVQRWFLRAPLAHASHGYGSNTIATARSGVPAQIRTGRLRWPVREEPSPSAASSHGHHGSPCRCQSCASRIPTISSRELAARIRDLKSKTGAAAVGASTASPPDRPSPGINKVAGARTPPGRWGVVTPAEVKVRDRHPGQRSIKTHRSTKQHLPADHGTDLHWVGDSSAPSAGGKAKPLQNPQGGSHRHQPRQPGHRQ